MARGIDAMRTRALDAGGGLDRACSATDSGSSIRRNRELYERMVAHGCLVTEHRRRTPARRLIPASQPAHLRLSRAVVVIEADARSGALVTATRAWSRAHDSGRARSDYESDVGRLQ